MICLFTAVLMGYVIATTDIDFILDTLSEVSLLQFALLISFSVIVGFLYECWQIQLILRRISIVFNYSEIVLLKGFSLILRFFNYNISTLLLSYFIREKKTQPLPKGLGALLVLNGIDVFNLSFITAIGILSNQELGHASTQVAYSSSVFYLSVSLCLLFILHAFFWPIEHHLRFLHFITRRSFFSIFRSLKPVDYLKFVLLRLPPTLMMVVVDYYVIGLFGIQVSMAGFFSVYPAVIFITTLPITISGLGSGQLAARALLVTFVVGKGAHTIESIATIDAFSNAIILFNLTVKSTLGVICLVIGRKYILAFRGSLK